MTSRVGIGYDSHRFVPGTGVILGGVRIPADVSLTGHSDADAIAHAVTDALLGAAALGDIGALFKMVGMTLVSTVGGSGGPLYGTLFLQLDHADVAAWRTWVTLPIELPRGAGALRGWFTFEIGRAHV